MPNKGNTKSNNKNIKINSKWLRNSLKSLGLASADALKEIMPATTGTTSSAATVARTTITDIKKSTISSNTLSKAIKNNPVVKLGNEYFKNAIADIKSGNLYNTERSPLGEDFGGEDFSFDDMGEDGGTINITNVSTDSSTGEATLKAIQDSSEKQLKSAEIMTNTMVSLSSTAMLNASKIGSDIVSELTNISSKLDSMIEYNNANMTKFIEASIAYYDQVTAKPEEAPKTQITASNLFSGGALNFNTYKEFIKQNLQSVGNVTEVGSIIKFLSDNKDMVTANPVGTLMQMAIVSAVPSSIKAAMQGIDTAIKEALPSLLEDIGAWGENDNTIAGQLKQTVASVFGTKTRFKNSANTRVVKDGPMQYNGIANHTLTEIIPKYLRESTEYLRVIAEKVTGQKSADMKERVEVFDREKGTYRYIGDVKKSERESYFNEVGGAIYNHRFIENLKDQAKSNDKGIDNEDVKKIATALGATFATQNGNLDYNQYMEVIDSIQGIQKELKDLIKDTINNNKYEINKRTLDDLRITATKANNSASDRLMNGPNAEYNAGNMDLLKLTNDRYGHKIFGSSERKKETDYFKIENSIIGKGIKAKAKEGFDVLKSATAGTVYAPMVEKFENVVTGIAETFKDKIWEPLSRSLFGNKDKDTGYYSDGMLSGLSNGALDILNKTKYLITGIPYKDRDGKTVGENNGKDSILGRFKSNIHDLIYGSEAEVDKDGNTTKKAKVGLIDKFKNGFNSVSKSFFDAIHNWKVALTGEESDKTGKELFDDFINKAKDVLPHGIAGAGVGGIIGTLVGGPVVGALTGFATGIASQSDSIKKFLFGDAKYDENGNLVSQSVEGFISEKTKKWFSEHKADIGAGAGIGLIGTLVGGPVVGALTGLATTFGQSEGIFKRFLFGDEEHGLDGIVDIWKKATSKFQANIGISEDNEKFLGMTALSSGLTGGLMGLAFGPGGFIGGSLMGLGASILAQKDNFHDWLFGKDAKDENGNVIAHEEGLLGQFKNTLIANVGIPLKNTALDIADNFKTWLEFDVLGTFKDIADPLLSGFFTGLSSLTGRVFESVDEIGNYIREDLLHDLVQGVGKVLQPLGEAAQVVAENVTAIGQQIIAAPLKLLATLIPVGEIAGKITAGLIKVADGLLVKPFTALVIKPLAGLTKFTAGLISKPFKMLGDFVTDTLVPKVEHVTAFVSSIFGDMKKAVGKKIEAAGAKLQEVFFTPIKRMGDLIKTAGAILTETGKKAIIEIKDSVKESLKKFTKGVADFLKVKVFGKIFGAIGKFLGDKAKDENSLIGKAANGVNKAKGKISGGLNYLKEKWNSTRDGFDRTVFGDEYASRREKNAAAKAEKKRLDKEARKERNERAKNQKLISKYSKGKLLEDTEENRRTIESLAGKKIDWKGKALETPEAKTAKTVVSIYEWLTKKQEKANDEMIKAAENTTEAVKEQESKDAGEENFAKRTANKLTGRNVKKFARGLNAKLTDALQKSKEAGEGLFGRLKAIGGVAKHYISGAKKGYDNQKENDLNVRIANEVARNANKHAKGTDNAPGGPSIVGEEGNELIMSPGKATLSNIVPGSKVLSHGKTEDLIDASVETSDVLSDAHDKSANALRVTLAENGKGIKGFFDNVKNTFKSLFSDDKSNETENDETSGSGYSNNSDDNASIAEASDSEASNVSALKNMIHGDSEVFDNTAANLRAIDAAQKQTELTQKAQKAEISTAEHTAALADSDKKKTSFFDKILKFGKGLFDFFLNGGLGKALKLALAGLGLASLTSAGASAIGSVADTINEVAGGNDRGNGNAKGTGENLINKIKENIKSGNLLQLAEDGSATALTNPMMRRIMTGATTFARGYLKSNAKGIAGKAGRAARAVTDVASSVGGAVKSKVSNLAKGAMSYFDDVNTIKDWYKEYGDDAFDMLGDDASPIKKGLAKAGGMVDNAISAGKQKVVDVGDAVIGKVTSAGKGASRWLGEAQFLAKEGAVADGLGQKVQLAVGKGLNAAKESKVGVALEKGGKAAGKLFENVKNIITRFINFITSKFSSQSGQSGNVIAKALSNAKVGASNLISSLKSKWDNVAESIGQKLALKEGQTAAEAGSTFILTGINLIVGGIDGITATKKLFHISEKPDAKMTAISTIIGALANTGVGGIINIVLQVINVITGLDILSTIATVLYNLWAGDDKAAKLAEEQGEFLSEYNTYKEDQMKTQFETQKKIGKVDDNVTFEEFKSGVEKGKYNVSYKSFADYNTTENASLLDKVGTGIGKGLKKGKEFLFGKKTESYKDKNGNTYTKGDDGNYTVTDKDGNKLDGFIDEATLKGMDDLEDVSSEKKGAVSGAIEKIKGFFTGIGDGFKKITGTIKEKVSPVIDGIKKGVGGAIDKVKGFFTGIGEGLGNTINTLKENFTPIIDVVKEKIGSGIEWIKGGVGKIIDTGKTVMSTMEKNAKNARDGNFQALMSNDIDRGAALAEGDYGSALLDSLSFVHKIFLIPATGISWVVHKLWDNVIKPIGSGIKAVGTGIETATNSNFEAVKAGDLSKLTNSSDDEEKAPEGPLGVVQKIANVITKAMAVPATAISWLLHKAYDNVFKPIVSGVKAVGTGVMDGAGAGIAAIIKGDLGLLIEQNEEKAPDSMGLGIVQTISSAIIRGMAFPLTAVSWVGHKLFEHLEPIIKGVGAAGAGFMSGVGNTFQAIAAGDFEKLYNNPESEKVPDDAHGVIFKIASFIPEVIGTPLTAVSWVGHKLAEKLKPVIDGAKEGMSGLKDGAGVALNAIKDGDFETLQTLGYTFQNGAGSATEGHSVIYGIAQHILKSVAAPIVAVSWVGHKVGEKLKPVIDGAKDGMDALKAGGEIAFNAIKDGDFDSLLSLGFNFETGTSSASEGHSILYGVIQHIIKTVAAPMVAVSWVGHKIGEKLGPMIETIGQTGKDLKAGHDQMVDDYWKNKDIGGLQFLSTDYNKTSEDNPLHGVAGAIMGVDKAINIAVSLVAGLGLLIYKGLKGVIGKVGPIIKTAGSNFIEIEKHALTGDPKGLLDYEVKVDEDVPLAGLVGGALNIFKMSQLPISGITWLGKNFVKGMVNIVKNIIPIVGTIGKNELELGKLSLTGDIEGLNAYKVEVDEDIPMGGMLGGILNIRKLLAYPLTGLVWLGKKVGKGIFDVVKGAGQIIGTVAKNDIELGKLQLTGDIEGLNAFKANVDEDVPLGGLVGGFINMQKFLSYPLTGIIWLGKKIGKGVKDAVDSGVKIIKTIHENDVVLSKTSLKGDIEGLNNFKPRVDEEVPLGGLVSGFINMQKFMSYPVAGIIWVGKKIGEGIKNVVDSAKTIIGTVAENDATLLQMQLTGDIEGLNSFEPNVDENVPLGGIVKGFIGIQRFLAYPITGITWVGKKIGEGISNIIDGAKSIIGTVAENDATLLQMQLTGDIEGLNGFEPNVDENVPLGGIVKGFIGIQRFLAYPITGITWVGKKVGEGISNVIDGAKTVFGSIGDNSKDIFDLAKSGDIEGLNGFEASVDEDVPLGGVVKFIIGAEKTASYLIAAPVWAGKKLVEGMGNLITGVKDMATSVGAYISTLNSYADVKKSMSSWDSEKIEGADTNPALGIVGIIIKSVMRVYIDIVRGVKGIVDKLNPAAWFSGDSGGAGLWNGAEARAEELNKKYTTPTETSDTSSDDGGGGFGPGSLNGGTYYSQNDIRWANKSYMRSDGGNDGATMGTAGCGPTAMAMAMSDITGRRTTPIEMADMARKSGDRDDTGTNFNFIDKSANAYGVTSNRQHNPTKDDIRTGLSTGNPMILAGTGGRPYTNKGHYVVAEGIDNDDNVYINDPRGEKYSGKKNLGSFINNTQASWSFNGPGGRMINTKYFGGYGGDFPTYSDLTEEELKGLANIIQHEQPGKEGHYAEASQMANLTDKNKDNPTKDDLIKKATGGWYNNGQSRYNAGKSGSTSIDSSALDAAKAVFKEGKRTLPRYVDEHDFFGDISSISTGSNVKDRSSYKKDETVIKNEMGSTYTFYTFPNDKADPFGYTDKNLKSKYKDVVWDLSTGKFTDGSSGSSSSGSGTVDASSLWVAIIKAVKKAIAEKKPGYHQAYVGCKINVGGKEIEVRPDCSGLVMACLKYYGYDVQICTANMLDDSSQMKTVAKFTRRSWNGWDDLKEGEVIVKNGHTEIFAKNEGGKHYVWNCGSDSTVNNPDISSDNASYTVVWTPGEPGPGALTASDLGITLSSSDATPASSKGSSSKSGGILSTLSSKLGSMSNALWEATLTGNWNIDWDSVFADQQESTDSSTTTDSSNSGGTTGTGKWPIYKQGTDPKYGEQWHRKPYSGSTYGGAACGPTSMAMVITGLTGQEVTPDMLPPKYGTTVGTSLTSGFSKAASDYGFKEIEQSQTALGGIDMGKIKSHIEQGHPVILSGTANGGSQFVDHPFTSAGHYVLAFGHDGSNFLINDPNDYKHNDGPTTYKIDTIKKSIKRFHAFESSDPKTSTTYPGHDGGSTSGSTNLDATGDNAAPEIFKYLKGKGFNDVGAAGVMGCWQAESHNDPSVLEGYYLDKAKAKDAPSSPEKLDDFTQNVLFASYDRQGISINKSAYKASDGHYYPGFGLAQWTGPLGYKVKQYGETHGGNWQKLGTQLDFFWDDFSARKKGLQETMNNKSSAADATTEFLDGYEMQSPGWHNTARGSKQNQTRRGYATDIYNKYKGQGGSGGGFGEGHDTAIINNRNYYTPSKIKSSPYNNKTILTTSMVPSSVRALKVNYNNTNVENKSNDKMEMLLTKVLQLLNNISNNSNYLSQIKDLKSEIVLNNNTIATGSNKANDKASSEITSGLNQISSNEQAARSIAYGY